MFGLSRVSQLLRDVVATCCLGLMASSLVTLPLPAADKTPQKSSPLTIEVRQGWSTPLDKDEKVLELLNRITFGPRPGDFERVKQMGLNKFLDLQLHPERIDDSPSRPGSPGCPRSPCRPRNWPRTSRR